MKRTISVILLFSLCLCLWGCTAAESNGTAFYYCRAADQFQYFEEDGVIRTELRDLAGHRNDLRYMVGLYLAGPMEEGLTLPFPKSTRLISVQQDKGNIAIEISGHSNILTDSEFTLGCACLTLTCAAFADCETVTVTNGERTVTMDADSILLYDTLPQQETNGG